MSEVENIQPNDTGANDTGIESRKPKSATFFARLALGIVLFVFGGLTLWSVVAPIDGAVVASGHVVVESNRKTVQHLEGGVIGEILVDEGDRVEAGDLLVRLEDTVQRANFELINGQLRELYARRARFEAERDLAETIAEPQGLPEVINSDLFQSKYAGQKRLFEARQTTRTTQISLLKERIVQQNERISGLRAQITSLRDQQRLINDELDGVAKLHEEGFAPKTRLRALQREAKRLGGELGVRRASIAEATSVISEAQLEIERLRDGSREEAITQLRDTEVSIAQLEERRITALDALLRTEIKAPQAGRVIGRTVHTVGGVISPGSPLMEIVPVNDRLQIAARVAPQDVDKVRTGQETLVRFTAFGVRRTPETKGKLLHVSADSLIDETTGLPYFLVLVEIPAGEDLDRLLRGEQLVPGMPVETFIRTGSKSAISYLLKPLTDSFARSLRED